MAESLDLHDCQCPACKRAALQAAPSTDSDRDAIRPGAISCAECGAAYDVVWGIPFLGAYEDDDFLTLVEVVANAGHNGPGRARDPEGRRKLAHLHHRLRDYHRSVDRASFEIEPGLKAADAPWWQNRYHEFRDTRALLADIELQGRRVLDVGAGTGFNSLPLVESGAEVTLFEVNLDLLRTARALLPEARTVAGCGRVLPFRSQSFDVVIANAALHHVRDLPTVIAEMLRVLRPGGWLLTMGDPFRPNAAGEDYELNLFRDHRDVLLGINEGVPRLGDFLGPLTAYRALLEIQILTGPATGVRTHLGTCDLPEPRTWTFEEMQQLANGGGSLSLKVRARAAIDPPQPVLRPGLLRPAALARTLDEPASAAVPLSRCVPPHLVDLPLLGSEHPRFRLLNGWKAPVPGLPYREAYGRARSFLRRRTAEAFLHVEMLAPHRGDSDQAEVVVLVDGMERLRRSLTRGLWHHLSVPAGAVAPELPANVEVHLKGPGDARYFFVRRLECHGQPSERRPDRSDLDRFGLPALAAAGALNERVSVLFGTDYELSVDILNRLRGLGLEVDATVSHNQKALFVGEPGVCVIGCYPDPSATPRRSPRDRHPAHLVVSTSADTAADLPLRRGADIFLVTAGGHARVFRAAAGPSLTGMVRRMVWRNWKNRVRPRVQGLLRRTARLLRSTGLST